MLHIKPISKILILVLWIANIVSAVAWDNGEGDNLWSSPKNWSNNILPTISVNVDVAINTTGPIVNSPTTAAGNNIRIGGSSGANLVINSGTLNTGEWLMVGIDQSGKPGTFTMNGGTVNLGSTNSGNGHLWLGYTSNGTFTINGGVLNVPGRFGLSWSGGTANAYLYGGTITAAYFSMTVSSRIDITEGMLIVNGDERTTINGYISSNWITAYGGAGTLVVDYDNTNPGKTTVTAYLNTEKASAPNPSNNSTDVDLNANLSWAAGTGATSHNIYFGTTNPPAFITNQTELTYEPGALELGTIYYWRIDEVNGSTITEGDLWNFTTTYGLAHNPEPANGSMNVSLAFELNWTSGTQAISHDVYLGTDIRDVRNAQRLSADLNGDTKVDYDDMLILSDYWLMNPHISEPYAGINDDDIVDFLDFSILAGNWNAQSSPWFKGNTTDNSFSPQSLSVNTTYYWRVDEVNGDETRKGDIWSFTTASIVSDYSLIGKIMCGYQGWFNTPGDGTTRGWVHWGGGGFSPVNCNVDMWPDMSEMTAGEKFLASEFYDGSDHYVFSSHNLTTVLRHFQWMQQYGIDGVYVQRFATEVTPNTPEFFNRNDVLSYCKQGANLYGRKYAVMYDLSGLQAGGTSAVINDWKYLVDTVRVGKDPCDQGYIFHDNKPVVALWGFGFGRPYEGQESYDLLNFFKNDLVYGGNVIMLGVDNDWRTSIEQRTLLLADIISPWTVGRYSNSNCINWITTNGTSEKNWCNTYQKLYLPVIWPGYSFHNADPDKPFNERPRYGGQFFWNQLFANVNNVGANMLYIAMFDEVDEATAIFKVSNNPPMPGGANMFITYNMDGYSLPSDEYLWLAGQAACALRGQIPLIQTRPER
ncbi:MAG: hypothetical protein A2Y10_00900 [Planctomycetes bacterium GWF2_41_51]|nr:MAG: hypothetical protein A2Y10_00900 [Planctomycetes bacterium GWF2_41_51]HBG28108.1 hypothetical protein [Phycisphaerales bacterium]